MLLICDFKMSSGRDIESIRGRDDLDFNVGYFSASHKINFTEGEDIKSELRCCRSKSKAL